MRMRLGQARVPDKGGAAPASIGGGPRVDGIG
jgi:hypothetical protein